MNPLGVLSHLSGLPVSRIKDEINIRYPHYSTNANVIEPSIKPPLHLPEAGKIGRLGAAFLDKRGLDPDWVEETFWVKESSLSTLGGLDYSHRLIIPIYWRGELVSFTSRTLKPSSPPRYLACPKRFEVTPHKSIVYIRPPAANPPRWLCVVEGPTDLWKLESIGLRGVATFGISWTMDQVMALREVGERFLVIYDNEDQAIYQAERLASRLRGLGLKAETTLVSSDPGELTADDVTHLGKIWRSML